MKEYALTAIQQRTVLALAKELRRVEQELRECQLCLDELAARYAADAAGLEDGMTCLFVQKDGDGEVYLQVQGGDDGDNGD